MRPSSTRRRLGWGVLLSILLFVAAAAGGLMYGGAVVPRDSGLAGPAIVLGYGFLFGLGGVIAGILTAGLARIELLPKLSLAAGAITVVMGIVLALWSLNRQA